MPSQRHNRKRRVLKAKIRGAAQTILDNVEGRKIGRPPEYHPGFCHLVEKSGNTTNFEIVELLGANIHALHDWKKEHPEFAQAIKTAKDREDEQVEKSLVHRAKGYSHASEKIFMTKRGKIVRAVTTEHYPPDPTSMIFWLKNRKRDDWRPDTQLQPSGTNAPDLASQLREELAAMEKSTNGGK